MRRIIQSTALLCITLIAATATLAQDAAPAAPAPAPASNGTASWASMFLMSDDIIGLAIIWTLLAMSAISVGYSIKLLAQYRKSMLMPEDTRAEIDKLISQKKYRDAIEYAQADTSYLGKLTSSALNEAANGYGAMERAIEEASDAETTRYLRPVEYLNVLGNIAPMLGLFGTVYGMIVAFQKLVDAGGNPNPADLAAGISTALVTTFWGLVVAIPALAAYALVRNKIDALTSEGMVVAEELISHFKPSGKRSSGGSSGSSGGSSGGGGASPRPRATPKPE